MKRIFTVLLLIVSLSACAPAAQGFVDLPPAQEATVAVIVAMVLALVFDFLIGLAPFLAFLRSYQEGFAIALSGLAVSALENALPTGSEALSITGVEFALAVILYLLGRTLLQRRGVKSFVKR